VPSAFLRCPSLPGEKKHDVMSGWHQRLFLSTPWKELVYRRYRLPCRGGGLGNGDRLNLGFLTERVLFLVQGTEPIV